MDRGTTIGMVLVSLFIIGCLVLQLVAGYGRRVAFVEPAPFLWPFINYPMYSGARREGAEIDRALVVGVRPDGTQIPIEPEDLGLSLFPYRRGPVEALLAGDSAQARIFRDMYVQRHGTRLVGLLLKYRPIIVRKRGLEYAPHRIVAEMYFAPDETPR